MWDTIRTLFQEYMGTGLIVGWYLIALLYLWFTEKDRRIRVLFLYMPLLLLFLYFNPIFARLICGATGDEIYYRILWLLPITVVIAYAAVSVYGRRSAGDGQRQPGLCQPPFSQGGKSLSYATGCCGYL